MYVTDRVGQVLNKYAKFRKKLLTINAIETKLANHAMEEFRVNKREMEWNM